MTRYRTPSRTLTTVAVGFLVLDGLLLAYGGLSLHRALLVVWGAVCLVGAGLVVFGWRRYHRAMADLERARQELHAEVASLRELLHGRHLRN